MERVFRLLMHNLAQNPCEVANVGLEPNTCMHEWFLITIAGKILDPEFSENMNLRFNEMVWSEVVWSGSAQQ